MAAGAWNGAISGAMGAVMWNELNDIHRLGRSVRVVRWETPMALHQQQEPTYEELLAAFGDGTENLGADEGMIQSLPTQKLEGKPEGECAICLDPFQSGHTRKTLPCLHGFHPDCVDHWLRSNGSCPICKHRLGT